MENKRILFIMANGWNQEDMSILNGHIQTMSENGRKFKYVITNNELQFMSVDELKVMLEKTLERLEKL